MAGTAMSEEDLANLSDDEIESMVFAPSLPEGEAASEQEDAAEGQDGDEDKAEGEAEEDGDAAEGDDGDEAEDADGEGAEAPGSEADDAASDAADILNKPDEESDAPPAKPGAKADEKVDPKAEDKKAPAKEGVKADDKADPKAKDKPADKAAEAPKEIDFKAAYEQIMAPFKANGKDIKLDSPEEAVRLMQMGANYTKKMQGLQPHLKMIRMLENNGVLDEKKLAFFIDLDKKKPEAIQKLIKDAGVDPMDLDTSQDPGYKPGNYQVSDQEMLFTTTVEEVASEVAGKEIVSAIHKTWDKASKDALFEDPEILRILTTQRKNGIYAQIMAEVDRRKMLGQIQANAPILKTYHAVGTEMTEKGQLKPTGPALQKTQTKATGQQEKTPAPSQEKAGSEEPRKVVDQRTGIKKPGSTVANGDKAKAALASKTGVTKKAVNDFSVLNLSDEDFEKNADLMRKV